MNQVILLLRNPRRAVPSYHTMRWELVYCKTWSACKLHIPDTCMKRPPVKRWEMWRDQLFNREIHSWYYFYDFWMQGGFMEHKNETHSKCTDLDIECQPQTLVDFENMFSKNLNDDFLKIGNVLNASTDVEVVSDQARACVLGNVMNRTDHQDLNMHQASRPLS